MKLKELEITIRLKKDISFINLPENLSKAMNMYFLANEESKKFHKENRMKLYSYSLLEPIVRNGEYKKNETYVFKVRFFENEIFESIQKELLTRPNNVFVVVGINQNIIDMNDEIKFLYTETPAILTKHRGYGGYWIPNEEELDFVKDKIIKNAVKKFNALNNSNLEYHEFIEKIEIKSNNLKAYKFRYKNANLIANKFKVYIKEDLLSQQLGYVLLGAGLLEKNSLSFGFCVAN